MNQPNHLPEDPAQFIKERRTAKDPWTVLSYLLLITAVMLQFLIIVVFDVL